MGYELDLDFNEDGMDSVEYEGGYEMAIDDLPVEDPMHASPVSKPSNGRGLNPTLSHMYEPTLLSTAAQQARLDFSFTCRATLKFTAGAISE